MEPLYTPQEENIGLVREKEELVRKKEAISVSTEGQGEGGGGEREGN